MLRNLEDSFPKEILDNEREEMDSLLWERFNQQEIGGDLGKPNDSGRRYFKGLFLDESKFINHQKRISDGIIEE